MHCFSENGLLKTQCKPVQLEVNQHVKWYQLVLNILNVTLMMAHEKSTANLSEEVASTKWKWSFQIHSDTKGYC